MKMTWKKLLNMIKCGYGSGHGDNYKPFLRISRRNTSKKSNQGVGSWLIGYQRQFHFFSRAERQIALGLWWLGAKDIREQFPMWPVPHPHPLLGAVGTEHMAIPEIGGLWEIAKLANIDHGVYVGTNVPYVGTIDLMVTVMRLGIPRLIAVSCKPRSLIATATVDSRMLERLELERLYTRAINSKHLIADIQIFSKSLIGNLEWLCSSQENKRLIFSDSQFNQYRDLLNRDIHRNPIDQTIISACKKIGWGIDRGNEAFRIMAWDQIIDIDISKPVLVSQPALAGGKILQKQLSKNILGDIDYV